MLRKVVYGLSSVAVVLAALYLLSGRGLGRLTSFARATADVSVEKVEGQLGDEIHDRKMEQDLRQARQELIDRQVQLNLARGQVDQARKDIGILEGNVARRQRLLAEAYPILKDATEQKLNAVRFASTEFSIDAFQREVDDLMALQERESQQLKAKREGIARLTKSLTESERALADMRLALEKTDQDVALLKGRREQAQVESSTLDMLAAATADHTSKAAAFGQGVERLKKEVESLEARNDARRGLAPVSEREPGNQLTRSWNRLEALKAYHDQAEAAGPAAADAKPASPPSAAAKTAVNAGTVEVVPDKVEVRTGKVEVSRGKSNKDK
jgi:chromosome segregation ATPase